MRRGRRCTTQEATMQISLQRLTALQVCILQGMPSNHRANTSVQLTARGNGAHPVRHITKPNIYGETSPSTFYTVTVPPLRRPLGGRAKSLKPVIEPDAEVSVAAPLRVRGIIVHA